MVVFYGAFWSSIPSTRVIYKNSYQSSHFPPSHHISLFLFSQDPVPSLLVHAPFL